MDIDSPGSAEEVVRAVGNQFDWNTAMFPSDVTRAVPPSEADAVIMASTQANLRLDAWTSLQWWTDPAQRARWSELTEYVPVAQGALNSPGFQSFVKASV